MKIPTTGKVYKCAPRKWGSRKNKIHTEVPTYTPKRKKSKR